MACLRSAKELPTAKFTITVVPMLKSCQEITQLTPLTETSKMCYLVLAFMQTVRSNTHLVVANVDVASPGLSFVCLVVVSVALTICSLSASDDR